MLIDLEHLSIRLKAWIKIRYVNNVLSIVLELY